MKHPGIELQYLPVSNLIKILEQLPNDKVVYVNSVGNLTILNEKDLSYYGFIDFINDGEIEIDE